MGQHHATFNDEFALKLRDAVGMQQRIQHEQTLITNLRALTLMVNAMAWTAFGVDLHDLNRGAQLLNPQHRRAHFVLLETFIRQTTRQSERIRALCNAHVVFKQVKENIDHG